MNRTQTAGEPLARRTRRILAQLGHRPRRSRGQSFLIDPSVAERIVALVADSERPQVLEVGAGLGALTDLLSARATRVVAVELDQALASALQGVLAHAAKSFGKYPAAGRPYRPVRVGLQLGGGDAQAFDDEAGNDGD